MNSGNASTQSQATILLVAITIILFAILLPILLGFLHLPEFKIRMIPGIFVITNVLHIDDESGAFDYDSRVIVLNTGPATYNNKDLKARIYRNEVPLNCVIETLNGVDFISTAHFGVDKLKGPGCQGLTWLPGELTSINLNDGTLHPGDTVRIDIIDKTTNEIISRHSYRVT